MGQKSSKLRTSKARESFIAPAPRQLHMAKASAGTPPHRVVTGLIREGKFSEAVVVARRVVQQNKSELGVEHGVTLASMFELGRALHGDGRVEKALQVFQELLPLNERVCGPSHADTLATLDAICEELCNMGKYELASAHLFDEIKRCQETLGPMHERTIRLLVDLANLSMLLDQTEEASSAFSLALDRSTLTLGPRHDLTLAIQNDLRARKPPASPDLEEMKAVLRRMRLPVSTEPFPNTKSATWRDTIAGKELNITMSVGYEASNAMSLRVGPINGEPKARAPFHVPTHYTDTTKVNLQHVSTGAHADHSFQSLINRSIGVLPRGGAIPTRQAVEKHVAFLKSLTSLDDLLTAKENSVWFFQHRSSFMRQTTFQRWDSESLERYVLLPIEGGLVNSEDCIFVSHYWRTESHPDPDGEDLNQLKGLLADGFWSKGAFLWTDWTCLPQGQRTPSQQQYFSRILPSISRLVRDCSFVAQYPEFRPRLWILFEVAAYTFNRAEPVGLQCTDTFQKHLLQMKGDGVRAVLDKYRYNCTNKGDRQWVITQLEILLALRKAVPSIHTQAQILNAIDNSAVRSCIQQEVGVEIDKERGILKTNETTYQFNPLPVKDDIPGSVPDVRIAGDHETRLRKALQRAGESFDDAGVGEIGREYDRAGDYRIAEVLHRRAMVTQGDIVASNDLAANLENQGQYDEAAALRRQEMTRPAASEVIVNLNHQKLVALQQKSGYLNTYRKWKFQSLEASLQRAIPPQTATTAHTVGHPAVRNGLRRSWLQRLDQSVWQSEDPVVKKSMEERGLELDDQGRFSEAQQIHWTLLGRRKESLGPCHADTRRSLTNLARSFRLAGNAPNAHLLYAVALAVCDFTLGPWHPESRALVGDVGMVVLLQGKLGLARSYYRQQLERTLAVAEWDDPEAFAPKFYLQALIGDGELQIVQHDENTTVQIMGYSPESRTSNPALAAVAAADEATSKTLREENEEGEDTKLGSQRRPGQEKIAMILDAENADFLFKRYILAR